MNSKSFARSFGLNRVAIATIRQNWQISIAVVLGVAVATAVIAGALLVGDSMRGSLRALTIERLGKTESLIAPGGFFNPLGVVSGAQEPISLMYFPSGIVESRSDDGFVRRAGSIQIIGCDDNFWDLDTQDVAPSQQLGEESVVLNQSAASELQVSIGDVVTLRLPSEQAVPADSPLGRREIESEGLPRMKVVDIIADRGLGRFAISASQAAPKNIYVERSVIGDVLDRDGQANLLLFSEEITDQQITVGLEDMGMSLTQINQTFGDEESPKTIFEYYSLTSDRLLLPEAAVDAVIDGLPAKSITPMSTYLANAIEKLDDQGKVLSEVVYSTITAIDSTPSLPLDYQLDQEDESDAISIAGEPIPLVINSWASKHLSAPEGTALRVAYFEPEVEDGQEVERYFDAVVSQVVPLTEPARPYRRTREAIYEQPPTIYNDPNLTPLVPGVTDQDSINDWDLPFSRTRDVPAADDEYWRNHRLTPKAFLPLADGQQLFGSRFGQTTSLRILPDESKLDSDQPVELRLRKQIEAILQPLREDLGWAVIPIRKQQLEASKGTTPFDGLFLALSFFVIAAAVLLIAMLFRLSLTQRTQQLGTMMAVGWLPSRVTELVLGEGILIAALGTIVGVAAGVLYAAAVLWALKTWWVGAVTVPFLNFYWSATSLLMGGLIGFIVSVATIWFTVRAMLQTNAQSLLSNRENDQVEADHSGQSTPRRSYLSIVAGCMIVIAIAMAALGAPAGGQIAAGCFVGGGMLMLISCLMLIYQRMRRPRRLQFRKQSSVQAANAPKFSVGSLASLNATRRPLRSAMTIGLMAFASFLIIAIGAFRLSPTDEGTGGFDLIAQSSQPIYRDLRTPKNQSEIFGPDAKELANVQVSALRLKMGQDASCNNLYQATQPTIVGLPDDFQGGKTSSGEDASFQWAGCADLGDNDSPWSLLSGDAAGTEEDPIPVILDQNTAMWSLQMVGGVGEVKTFTYQNDQAVTFKVVGLLSNSILQGKLIIGESNFEQTFPTISGYQFFLMDAPERSAQRVAEILETRLGDAGMDVSNANDVLAGMLAVQNTYLTTFQSLGALGLLLGTIGLTIAQVRSVIERQQELAVLRAIGFTRSKLASLVLTETVALLLAGIGCGLLCAVLSVIPHAWVSGVRPPLMEPLLIVVGILVLGMVSGMVAVRRVSRIPLLQSLRSE